MWVYALYRAPSNSYSENLLYQWPWDHEQYRIKGHQYSTGTSFSAPQNITEKPMEVYYLDEWIMIILHVAGFLHPAIFWYFHHSSDKSGLKVTDCTVQSAEYWCFYGTLFQVSC